MTQIRLMPLVIGEVASTIAAFKSQNVYELCMAITLNAVLIACAVRAK